MSIDYLWTDPQTGNIGRSEEGNWVTVEQGVEGGCFTSHLFRIFIF